MNKPSIRPTKAAIRQILSEIDESNAQVVGNVSGKPVTRGQLSTAFDLVKAKNWKDPIYATVEATDTDVAMITEAVIFFTGSVPEFAELKAKAKAAGETIDFASAARRAMNRRVAGGKK